MAQRESLWPAGVRAVSGALLATLGIWLIAVAVLEIPPEFLPLAGPGPTVFFTAMGGLGAVGVFGLLRRSSSPPAGQFRVIAGVVLVLSFVPDLWLLSDSAVEVFPGATPAGVGVLMTMHFAAAAMIVWGLTGRPVSEEEGP
jgi:hypothetical protein